LDDILVQLHQVSASDVPVHCFARLLSEVLFNNTWKLHHAYYRLKTNVCVEIASNCRLFGVKGVQFYHWAMQIEISVILWGTVLPDKILACSASQEITRT
jgi:hypothetical protein